MVPSPGTCEIVEAEELDSVGRLKETRLSSFESKLDESGKSSMLKLKHKYSLEDELNQLFEAIDLRMQTRGSGSARQSGTDSSQKVASKKPMRIGVSQASGIGISESVTLKQALRKVCISHASEMAATKRLSKSVGSSGVSEAGTIKRLYRAVVVEASESGLRPDEGKGSLVEISLVPEKSTLDLSNKIPESFQAPKEDSSTHSFPSAVATATELSLAETQTQDETVFLPTEAGKEESTMKLKQEAKLKSALSPSSLNIPSNALELDEAVSASTEVGSNTSMPDLVQNVQPQCSPSPSNSNTASTVKKSSINSSCLLKPVFRNKCFSKKKVKQDPAYTCSSSNTCIEDGKSDLGSSTSKLVCPTHYCNENITKEYASQASINASPNVEGCSGDADSGANKPCFSSNNYDAKASESSISREKGSSSQSSKSTMCGYRSSISISDETSSRGSSYSGSRPHMSTDLRWDAIHRVEMQHGTIGLRHFKLLKRLGCGDIGTVYLAELTGTECLFAVKVMDTEFLASRKKTIRARTEREILQMLDHPFLPTLFAHFTTDKFSCLVMEYCPGGDLHILRQKQPGGSFTEQEARFYVAEILLALEYLHMLGVVYRDLKPENILVREDGHIMLSDFDLSLRCTVRPTLIKMSSSIKEPSKRVSAPCMESTCIHPFFLQPSCVLVPCLTPRRASAAAKTQKLKPVLRAKVPQLLAEPTSARSNSFVGTHEYLAPEIIKGEGHGNAVDWWTFGIFLYELLFGKTPFKGLGNEDTLVNVVMHSVKFPASPSVSSQAKDLIRGLLVKEPEDRLGSVRGAAEIRQHPFFEGLNWALIRCAIPPMLPKSCDPVLSLVSEENKPIEGQNGEENSEFGQF